jgi:hypothetical protein
MTGAGTIIEPALEIRVCNEADGLSWGVDRAAILQLLLQLEVAPARLLSNGMAT